MDEGTDTAARDVRAESDPGRWAPRGVAQSADGTLAGMAICAALRGGLRLYLASYTHSFRTIWVTTPYIWGSADRLRSTGGKHPGAKHCVTSCVADSGVTKVEVRR